MAHLTRTLPVDWNVLRDATDNNKASIKEVLAIYLHQGIKNVKELRTAVQRNDPDQVVMLAHRFLGSSRFIGATQIGKPLTTLVKMGRSHHLRATAAQLVNRTEKELVRIDQYVKIPHD